MPYSSLDDMQFWGQFSSTDFGGDAGDYTYNASIQRLIDFADGEIDDYVGVPKGFFNAGGIVVENEYHDGKHLPSGNKPLLRPNYLPILINPSSYTKLEYLESGSWATKTEGNSSDYIVLERGIILVTLPDRTTYKNIRLAYKCGYAQTPQNVNEVSGRLSATIGQLILDSSKREDASLDGLSATLKEFRTLSTIAFTPELKEKLRQHRLNQVQVYRG